MKLLLAAIAAVTTVFLSGCGNGFTGAASQTSAAASALALPAGVDPTQAAAAAYCVQTHGEVEVRRPVYGQTASKLLFLAGSKNFCQYTKKGDGSRIHILLETLYTTQPSLAALAYILKPPMGSCHGNPASCYCSFLGASDLFGGISGAGGGWYKKHSVDQILEACIFPDMSSIDSWGLAYHSQGIVRGIDLQKVMRYKYPGAF